MLNKFIKSYGGGRFINFGWSWRLIVVLVLISVNYDIGGFLFIVYEIF